MKMDAANALLELAMGKPILNIVIPPQITRQMEEALGHAGHRETGGVLMAEHVGTNEFVVRDITIHKRGAFASFLRRVEEALAALRRFFDRTGQSYTRFNYIGEWHSHPSFELSPSQQDQESMFEIIADPAVGANFVVLIIVKLGENNVLTGSVRAYLQNGGVEPGNLVIQRAQSGGLK